MWSKINVSVKQFKPPAAFSYARFRHLHASNNRSLQKVSWDDFETIADWLHKQYPNKDPLCFRFTEIHDAIMDIARSKQITLDGGCSEGALEKIQMEWLEAFKDGQI